MGVGTFFHHIGTVLLLAATALLIVVSVTAPVVHDLSILRVNLSGGNNGDRITFGTFGYCQINVNGADRCSKAHVGYQPTDIIQQIDHASFSNANVDGARILTRVMILHPIAAGLCFLAFLLCLGVSCLGSIVAALLSFLSFLATVIAMACDFAGFQIVKNAVNDQNNSNAKAEWGPGIWCALAAAVCSLLATILVLITCCAGRSKRTRRTKKDVY